MLQGDNMKRAATKKVVKKIINNPKFTCFLSLGQRIGDKPYALSMDYIFNSIKNDVLKAVESFRGIFVGYGGFWDVLEEDYEAELYLNGVETNYDEYFGEDFLHYYTAELKNELKFNDMFSIDDIKYSYENNKFCIRITFTENDKLTIARENYKIHTSFLEDQNEQNDRDELEEEEKKQLKKLLKKYGAEMLKELD
jgi:hypothetical protein